MVSQRATISTISKAEYGIWRVILSSAAGTMIEWYDFFIFGSLVAVLSLKFYPPGNYIFAYIAYLTTFAVGFVVRPFGALFFGRVGDVVGRKCAFLATLSIMGGATALIGLLPTFKRAGWLAPITVLIIRTLQGLAVGGEYGGAAVYVAEHVPDHKRGFYTRTYLINGLVARKPQNGPSGSIRKTDDFAEFQEVSLSKLLSFPQRPSIYEITSSFIQITGMLGLFVSLMVVRLTEQSMSKEAFDAWGWRLPFLLSIFLVGISLYVRSKMRESPIFATIKSAGKAPTQPLKDAFTKWENLRGAHFTLWHNGGVWRCSLHGTSLSIVLLADDFEAGRENDYSRAGGGDPDGVAFRNAVRLDI